MGLILTVSNIYKSYNGISVLKDCSFSFDRGGIYVLTGPNGSGKSTLLRICALLEHPDSGEINYLNGKNILKKDIELKRKITLVLPKVGIFNSTVFKNVAYGLKIRGINKKEIEERVMEVLDFVGLRHKKDHKALTLSSGEIQRLGIARAMVIEPEILFLDEPTASVDIENTRIIEDLILNMKRKYNTTIIVTTHDISQAKRLGDVMLLMTEGKILEKQESL